MSTEEHGPSTKRRQCLCGAHYGTDKGLRRHIRVEMAPKEPTVFQAAPIRNWKRKHGTTL